MFDFQLIKNKVTGIEKVVEELDDNLFNDNWRHVKFLSNSKVDYVSYIADLQEESDKANNEPVAEHVPTKSIKPHTETLFKNCDVWRYEKDSVFEQEVNRVKSYSLATWLFVNSMTQ